MVENTSGDSVSNSAYNQFHLVHYIHKVVVLINQYIASLFNSSDGI